MLRGPFISPVNTIYTTFFEGRWPLNYSKMDTFLTGVCLIYHWPGGDQLIRGLHTAHPTGHELCHSVGFIITEERHHSVLTISQFWNCDNCQLCHAPVIALAQSKCSFRLREEVSAHQFPQNVKSEDRDELISLQQRLESKIQVIAPAIDMIELM